MTIKTALFIDGPFVWAAAKSLGFDIDFKRLLTSYERESHVVRAYYYTPILDDENSSTRSLTLWLEYNGFFVVKKQSKEILDAQGRKKIRGSLDIELAVDAMGIAERVDHIVLFAGDAGFRCLVQALQGRGIRVTIVAPIGTSQPSIADDLRRQADCFVDLATLKAAFCRDPSERPPRAPASAQQSESSAT